MGEVVRYRPKDANYNAHLLLALLEAWGFRCYLCGKPLDFADSEIDHIIPHAIGPEELEQVLLQCLTEAARAEGFDVHAPHNLAPACERCNGSKSATTYSGAGQMMIYLDKARKKQPAVEKRMASFKSSNAVTKALLAVSLADLSDPKANAALHDLAPMVVNRLRSVAPELLQTPLNYDYPGDPQGEELDAVIVTLNESSQRAKVILEDIHHLDFNDVLTEVERAIKPALEALLRQSVEHDMFEKGYGDAVVDGVGALMRLKISRVSYDLPDVTFEVGGDFEIDGSVEVNVASATSDSGTEEVQEYADASGAFSVRFWPDEDSETAGVEVDEPILDPSC